MTSSLRALPWGRQAAEVLAASLVAADPAAAVGRQMRRVGDELYISDQAFNLAAIDRVLLIAIGKAAGPMAHAAAAILGDRLAAGVVVAKDDGGTLPDLPACLSLHRAGHPVPDERGVAAAAAIADLLATATARDLVLALISGGGSALVTLPAPGVELADLQQLTGQLLACGATIGEINGLRKHLDLIKGGGLARMASPAPLAALILSDVVGSPLDVIASGPSVPDPSTFAEALATLDRYGLRATTPPAILGRLEAGARAELPETPKPGDPLFDLVSNRVVGSNAHAANAAVQMARVHGFATLLLTTALEGEARVVGGLLAAIAREVVQSGNPIPAPACIVAGGETTVTLRGAGKGGRNQELALAAAHALSGLPNVAVIALATDGGDGPTDAAGAVATGTTRARSAALGLSLAAHLDENNAYPYFAALGDLLLPGPTGTNVNDLVLVFVGAPAPTPPARSPGSSPP